MKIRPRKDLDTNCQIFLDYLISLKQEPVVMSVRNMDVTFTKRKPSLGSKVAMLKRLEKLGAIKYKRDKKFKWNPIIIILKEKI